MIRSVLIANRGEIACRVIRTARRMGIRSVAVYSDADANARHVALADQAFHIGPAAAAESYLNVEAILRAGRESGAEAIHPGYGFLSENAGFAEACAKAGIVFIGPPPSAIESMGSKSGAKALMVKAGVPVVPGYHGADQSAALLKREAEKIGFPVLIKATAGGGGRGMRVVETAEVFDSALESAQRESQAAFGDARVLVEKYLERPRHIEIQVFADGHGNAIHLYERECSIQRRHQKVIEEAPAPGLSPERRAAMGQAAVAAAKAVGYVGAGTVEFIAGHDGAFHFMEMNTRLQVEHPVTEMITGLDLVEWQFRVASGEKLPLTQVEIPLRGHAIEARVYAEDPARGFLPSTGSLRHLRFPKASPDLRVETGVRPGDAVSIHYDAMIAKLVAWGEDRGEAVRRMASALAQTQVVGVASNVTFLSAVVAQPDFAAGQLDTGFIPRHEAALLPPQAPAPDDALALAVLHEVLARAARAKARAAASGDPHSPWHTTGGWRLNDTGRHALRLRDGERTVEVMVHYRKDGWRLDLPGGVAEARGRLDADGDIAATIGGRTLHATVVRAGAEIDVFLGGQRWRLVVDDPLAAAAASEQGTGHLTAPMPGKVLKLLVQAGDTVARGAPLMVLEAMKMEHTIAAPADGTVTAVNFQAGEQVSEGAELLAFEANGKTAKGKRT
ncbi:MAG: acetyl-CoA carboxylase biotin carboxylase subunit [Alphaproteobacteria bacterium]